MLFQFRTIFLILFLFSNLLALEAIKPTYKLKANGAVQAFVIKNNLLYAATDNGIIDIFDINTQKETQTIKLPMIKDFMGDLAPAKIYSIDFLKNKLIFVSQGEKGFRNLWIYENEKLEKIIGVEKKFFIKKASFIDDSKIIFALLSNQIGIYDLTKKKVTILTQVSQSSFSYFKLSEDKKTLATTDESGVVRVLDTKDLRVLEELKALNLDRVYQLDFKKNKILTAGQDRKAVLYENINTYTLSFDFLLYSCALSPNATLGAIAYNEENEILVFNTKTKEYLYNLKGHDTTLTQIFFKNDKELFSSSDSQIINYWSLK